MRAQRQTIQIRKPLIEAIKKVAELNKRSLASEIEYVMTQHVTANETKVKQYDAMCKVAEQGNLNNKK